MNPFPSEADNNFDFPFLPFMTNIVEFHTTIKYSVNIVWVEKRQRLNLREISNILSWLYYAWSFWS